MTRNKYLAFIGPIIIIIAVVIFSKDSDKSTPEVVTKSETSKSHTINKSPIKTNRVVPSPISRNPASIGYVNKPSPHWQNRLETSLKEQGGDSLKNIQIKKERSLTWTRDEVPLSVESVIITLTNQQNEESSFRAIVDSQTGKVLETWDRTIFDPADVRAGFQIKLKDHYSN